MTDLPVAEVGGEDLSPIAAPLGSRTRTLGQKLKDSLLAYLFLLPALVVFALFAYYPLYRLFFYATHSQSRFRTSRPPTSGSVPSRTRSPAATSCRAWGTRPPSCSTPSRWA